MNPALRIPIIARDRDGYHINQGRRGSKLYGFHCVKVLELFNRNIDNLPNKNMLKWKR